MTVVVYKLNEQSEFEELGRSSDDGTDEALFGIYPEGVWNEESEQWLVERLDGPYVVGEIAEDTSVKQLAKFWTEYVGPEGGEGWENLMTGEVRYQQEEPSSDETPDHGVDVAEPESDSAFSGYSGISDASFIRDHLPVTAKFTDESDETHYGQIERADVGGLRSEFVVAAANGRRYHVEEDNIEGYIEPDPEWNPVSEEEDEMWQNEFERLKEELGDETIPPIPTRDMGNGGTRPETTEFTHIGDGKVTDEHVRILQDTIANGDLGAISVDFAATGNDVDHGPWDTDITDWHDGGQFAHVDTEMPVEDFLATQATMLASDRDHPIQAHRSFFGSARADDVEEYADVLENEPGELPMPFIEIGRHGRMKNYQEGRHRALAAAYAGHDTMPVRMVVNAEREGREAADAVQWPRDRSELDKAWIPYRGPQGGEGWQNVENPDDTRYQEDPPGEVVEGYEEWADGWGEYASDDDDTIQGATVVEYPVSGTDDDLRIPDNFTMDDIKNTARSIDVSNGRELYSVVSSEFAHGGYDNDKTGWLRATAQALEQHPKFVGQFNETLHETIRNHPNADFEVPFGMDGPKSHNLLEDTFGRFSDIVSDLEDAILFDDDRDEGSAREWVMGAQQWIRVNGDREMAQAFDAALNAEAAENPFTGVEANVPDHMNPALADRVTPISDTGADTGISSESMFIAETENGERAFVTNTSYERAKKLDGVDEESKVAAQRAMAGYRAFEVADMDVPQHEHVEDEYWSVEESPGVPAKDWNGDPSQIDREQFYKLGAVGMLSGNWDLHGGNVFVTDDAELVPIDLDLSGHMTVDDYRRNTAWGRLKRLGDKLGLFDRIEPDEVAEMKTEIARKTTELVEDGTADDIKSVASRIEHNGIQMNIEENVFAAKDRRLYDDEVWPDGGEQ